MQHLPMIYLITGISAIFVGPLVGKAADKYGKFKVFSWGAVFTILTVNIFTHLEVTPLWIVIFINVVMFASIFSRMIPSQALISSIPAPENRGSFMAVNSSLQQFSGGVASMIAGLIVVIQPNGHVEHFEVLGYLLAGTTVLSVYLMYVISRRYEKN
ncbi:MAG: MFS transporter, partial [Pseudobdellovibrio sp.]